ncbi:MAG: 6-phosphogluconolactonase [Parachlamydiaceae bacterium]
MEGQNWKDQIIPFDGRRNLVIPGNKEETIFFCANQFIEIADDAIKKHGIFTVALSGGSTPNALFSHISESTHSQKIDWSKVLCFWSDERSVPPQSSESNYFNAMKAGLGKLPLIKDNIFRMHAEGDIQNNAEAYERIIKEKVPHLQFDLMMLGMGEDGHTASLFPHTEGLYIEDKLVIANYVPQKQTWRMSLSYQCIELAKNVCIYVIGENKAEMVAEVLLGPYDVDHFPIQKIGTCSNQALWVMDDGASERLR